MEFQIKGRTIIIDDDLGIEPKNYYWDLTAKGYARFRPREGRRTHTPWKRLHRHVLGLKNRGGEIVDHININTFDNRRLNLRIVTASESIRNRRPYTYKKKSTSGEVRSLAVRKQPLTNIPR